MCRTFGIGTVVVDHVLQLPQFPDRDSKVAVDNHWRQIGGPVPVALSTLAFFGGESCFLGRWGEDDAGRMIQKVLKERRIQMLKGETKPEWSTGFAHVWTEPTNGDRTIAFSRGRFPQPTAADVDEELLSECEMLHLDGWAADAAIFAAERMRAAGGTVVLDAGSNKPRLDELLPLVDVLIASRQFRRDRYGRDDVPAKELMESSASTVVITNGADGAAWISADETVHQPGFTVDAIDTNGAGDVFFRRHSARALAKLEHTTHVAICCSRCSVRVYRARQFDTARDTCRRTNDRIARELPGS